MNLKRTTALFIAGGCYIFLSRTAGTLWPEFWWDLAVARASVILAVPASLTAVLFFLSFLNRYARPDQIELRNASMLAAIGSALFVLIQGKGLLVSFDLYRYNSLVRFRTIEAVIPVAGALLILLFFITLYGETYRVKEKRLKRPVSLAMIGSAVSVCVRLIILINYLNSGTGRWFSDLPVMMRYAIYPALIFGFGTLLYFLVSFYRSLDVAPAG